MAKINEKTNNNRSIFGKRRNRPILVSVRQVAAATEVYLVKGGIALFSFLFARWQQQFAIACFGWGFISLSV